MIAGALEGWRWGRSRLGGVGNWMWSAKGRPNAEIGRTLFIRAKTVSVHVTSID